MRLQHLRIHSRWLAPLALVCALALDVPASAASPNLLVNPGFEEGLKGHPWMPSGWDTSQAASPSVFFGRDSFFVHGGRYSVNIANASALYHLAHNWSQALLVDPADWGKDLVLTVWTKSNGVEGRAYVKVDAYRDTLSKMAKIWNITRDEAAERLRITGVNDAIQTMAWKRLVFTDPETDWVKREVRVFLPPSSNVAFVRCGIMGTGQLFIDDASLTLEPPLPAEAPVGVNLMSDPGFEEGGSSWEYSLPPYAEMRADLDSTVKHSGRVAMRMSSPSEAIVSGKTGVCQAICNRALAGKRVRFTGFIKTDSLVSKAFLQLFSLGTGEERQTASVVAPQGTTDWEEASLELDLPPETYSVWAWFTYTAPARGRVYFDDASLEVLGPAKQHNEGP
jgi:hypothetical protein